MQTMQLFALALLAVCAPSSASLALEFENAGDRPVSKVVKLLQGMQDQLEKEAKDDEDINEKMECWCKTNEADKNRIISESDETISTQTASVEQNTALADRLTEEIRQLTKEVAANKATLEKARVLRDNQIKEFQKDEEALLANLEGVSQAEAQMGSSLLQSPQGLGITARLKRIVENNYEKIRAKTTRADRMLLDDFLKDPSQFGKGAGFLQKQEQEVGGAGDTIDGILQGMKHDFEGDLKAERDEDAGLQKSYQELVAAKTKEVAAGEDQITTKEEQKADAKEKVITGKQDIKAATASKDDAVKYLKTVTEKCADSRAEYNERMKTRSEEQTAVGKAIEVLDGDEAHATFKRSLSFLQEDSESTLRGSRESRVADVLSSAGKQLGKQALVTLGLKAKAGGFTKVKKAIEDMVVALKQEQKDEIAQNDECIKDLNDNNASAEEKTLLETSLDGRIGELNSDISQVSSAIATLKGDVDEMQEQIKAAAANREKETSEFKGVIADQQQTQKLLKKALSALKGFYAKEETSLVEVHAHLQLDQKPEGFKEYKKSNGGAGVMALIQQIKEDSERMEAEAKQAEEDSKKAFEELTAETQAEIVSKTKDMGNKAAKNANLKADLSQNKQNLRATKDELADLEQTNFALHQECDFVMKNFDLRQKKREEEMEALQEAKVILG